jgi:hypothetical protein
MDKNRLTKSWRIGNASGSSPTESPCGVRADVDAAWTFHEAQRARVSDAPTFRQSIFITMYVSPMY